mgnify:CR=1 FL=1
MLANEEVINGLSERGDHPVQRLPLRQWLLKITDYADRLEAGLDGLDWPSGTMTAQQQWIGKSQGCNIDFGIDGMENEVWILHKLHGFCSRDTTNNSLISQRCSIFL